MYYTEHTQTVPNFVFYVYTCVCTCMCMGALRDQKRVSDSPKLELQMDVGNSGL